MLEISYKDEVLKFEDAEDYDLSVNLNEEMSDKNSMWVEISIHLIDEEGDEIEKRKLDSMALSQENVLSLVEECIVVRKQDATIQLDPQTGGTKTNL